MIDHLYKRFVLEWIDPALFAQYIDSLNIDYIFLYSSLFTNYSGRFSFLCYKPISKFNDIKKFDNFYRNNQHNNLLWLGYFGYELKNQLEHLPKTLPSFINMPTIWLYSFEYNIIFDHQKKTIEVLFTSKNYIPSTKNDLLKFASVNQPEKISVLKLMSNMTKESYFKNIEKTLNAIKRGDFYQANITRKFYGYLNLSNNRHIDVFLQLCKISPSPYSSFLRLGKYRIISSSPEMFIKITDNIAETRPIKGTAPRFDDKIQDNLSKNHLINSEKDKSENLMIVDLMRNDFARQSIPGSVHVNDLFKVHSYSTIHHMFSTIRATKKNSTSPLEFIKNCFPPGSVTGAPKIQVMKWCSEIERLNREAYCGGIGWLNNNDCDLSVTIRTLIISGNKFEFQVGGGITYESSPYQEWQETLFKAKAIANVLNISIDSLSF